MMYIKMVITLPRPSNDFRSPRLVYAENDDENWEVRKVEIFEDGRMAYADETTEMGFTGLSEEPTPPGEYKNPHIIFDIISKLEFETLWTAARRAVAAERR